MLTARFKLLVALGLIASALWGMAVVDYLRFSSAMSLRIESCRCLHQGQSGEAAKLLERAFQVDPSQLDIAWDLAAIYWQTGNLDAALVALDHAVKAAPCDPRQLSLAYSQRGRFYLAQGKFREASLDLRAALSWAPRNEQLRDLLTCCQKRVVWAEWFSTEPVPPLSLRR